MGQGGNVFEWTESAFAGTNNSTTEDRFAVRGGNWDATEVDLRSSARDGLDPSNEVDIIGFRVASVPEPSTYALLLMAGAGWLLWKRLKASL
jgi:formylglycine-generating enzyme required for sulfatase activity